MHSREVHQLAKLYSHKVWLDKINWKKSCVFSPPQIISGLVNDQATCWIVNFLLLALPAPNHVYQRNAAACDCKYQYGALIGDGWAERARRHHRAKQVCTCARVDAPHLWINPPPPGLFLYPLQPGGGGRIRPTVLSRKRMDAERRTRRHSKDLDEMLPKHFRKYKIEVTCQVKVRSKVKIGCFQVADRSDLKRSIFSPKLSICTPKDQ